MYESCGGGVEVCGGGGDCGDGGGGEIRGVG